MSWLRAFASGAHEKRLRVPAMHRAASGVLPSAAGARLSGVPGEADGIGRSFGPLGAERPARACQSTDRFARARRDFALSIGRFRPEGLKGNEPKPAHRADVRCRPAARARCRQLVAPGLREPAHPELGRGAQRARAGQLMSLETGTRCARIVSCLVARAR